jgi:hypothetical protein
MPITWLSEYHPREGRNEWLIDLCVTRGARGEVRRDSSVRLGGGRSVTTGDLSDPGHLV